MSDTPARRWPESEIETLTGMPRVSDHTPPPPAKRQTMEKNPEPLRPPTREEVEAIEDQILRLAFGKAMKSIRRRTLALVFLFGIVAGFVALGVTIIVLLDQAGAR